MVGMAWAFLIIQSSWKQCFPRTRRLAGRLKGLTWRSPLVFSR